MVPLGLYAVLALIIVFILILRIEMVRHENNLRIIPIRIWVNGTRGKSSVTRLIAAGLRAGGKRVIAKTTGTSPRFITNNAIEQPVIRLGMANIKEQMKIVQRAAQEHPDAIVLECMALRPDLQQTESRTIVRPTSVIITNVRPDHLDVMGPTIHDIARAFIEAVPRNCMIFTSEPAAFKDFVPDIHKKNIELIEATTRPLSETVMKKFSYIEHKENIRVALEVCAHFGIDEQVALEGMYTSNPDPGALQLYSIDLDDKHITFVYAMAANDPESTYRIWQSINKDFPEINILVNCRSDRIDQSFQLAKLINEHLRADHYILTGSGTDVLARKIHETVDSNTILNLGGKKPDDTVHEISRFVSDNSLLFAIGNTVGYGEEMVKHLITHQR
jgi:poly-gamma-glutamate synthase PgsB/CapB